MESMLFHITDQYGQRICDPMMIPFVDLYWIKQMFVCEIQYGQLVLF